eukprot:15353860-Alexandrium_andersonii.AAC.1
MVDDANLHAGALTEATSSKTEAFTEEDCHNQLAGPRTFTYSRRGAHHLITVPVGMAENDMAEFLQKEVRACEAVTQAAYASVRRAAAAAEEQIL